MKSYPHLILSTLAPVVYLKFACIFSDDVRHDIVATTAKRWMNLWIWIWSLASFSTCYNCILPRKHRAAMWTMIIFCRLMFSPSLIQTQISLRSGSVTRKNIFFHGSGKNFNQTRWDRKFPRLTCFTCRPGVEFECFSLTFHRRWNALDGTSSSTSTLSPHIFQRNIHMVRRCSPNIIIFFILTLSLSFIKMAFFAKCEYFPSVLVHPISRTRSDYESASYKRKAEMDVQNVVHFIFRLFRTSEVLRLSTANLPNIFPFAIWFALFERHENPFLNWCRAKIRKTVRQIAGIGFNVCSNVKTEAEELAFGKHIS